MKIHVELVTPEALMFSGDAESIEVPGSEGDFGVLPSHSPMISSIRPGIVSIHTGGKPIEVFVAGGFVEVTGDRCTILAEESVDVTDTTADKKSKLISDAVKKLDS